MRNEIRKSNPGIIEISKTEKGECYTMMKEEFEKLTTRPFTASEYKEIEYVYNYHPSIGNKAQIASLYNEFGMRIIRDMRPTAEKAEEYESEMRVLRAKLASVETAYKNLKNGICDC